MRGEWPAVRGNAGSVLATRRTQASRRCDTLRSHALTAIVDTQEEAAALDLPPLLVRRPLEAFLDAHGLGSGPLEAEPVGDGHSNVTYLIRRDGGEWVLRRPPRPPLPPSRARRPARGVPAARARAHRRARAARCWPTCDDESRDRRAVLRDGARRGRRAQRPTLPGRHAPASAIGEELIDALVEVHAADWQRVRARGLRQADRLPRAPAAPLHRPLGAQRDARDRGAGRRDRVAGRAPARSPARRRSSTATTGSAT